MAYIIYKMYINVTLCISKVFLFHSSESAPEWCKKTSSNAPWLQLKSPEWSQAISTAGETWLDSCYTWYSCEGFWFGWDYSDDTMCCCIVYWCCEYQFKLQTVNETKREVIGVHYSNYTDTDILSCSLNNSDRSLLPLCPLNTHTHTQSSGWFAWGPEIR